MYIKSIRPWIRCNGKKWYKRIFIYIYIFIADFSVFISKAAVLFRDHWSRIHVSAKWILLVRYGGGDITAIYYSDRIFYNLDIFFSGTQRLLPPIYVARLDDNQIYYWNSSSRSLNSPRREFARCSLNIDFNCSFNFNACFIMNCEVFLRNLERLISYLFVDILTKFNP